MVQPHSVDDHRIQRARARHGVGRRRLLDCLLLNHLLPDLRLAPLPAAFRAGKDVDVLAHT